MSANNGAENNEIEFIESDPSSPRRESTDWQHGWQGGQRNARARSDGYAPRNEGEGGERGRNRVV